MMRMTYMNIKYKELFTLIAQTMEMTAEKAMDENKKSNNLTAYQTSKEMRAKYARLHDLLTSKTVDYKLEKNDFIDLAIGATVVMKQMNARIEQLRLSYEGYEKDLLPKLQEAANNPEKIDEIFSLND